MFGSGKGIIMKIRTGLVSNSSSSSFLLYGCSFCSEEEIYEAAMKTKEGQRTIREAEKEYNIDYSEGQDGLAELFDFTYGPNGDYYFGASWGSVKDDETGAQFKEHIRKDVASLFGEKYAKECYTYEEAWRDS